MTSDTKFRLAFCLLMGGLLVLVCRNVLAQDKPITIDVVPKAAMVYPYDQQTFRVTVRIARHKDNRLWSFSGSCGTEIKSSEHELTKDSPITTTWYEEMTVTEECIFQACLHRAIAGKVKNFCVYQGVITDENPP